METRAVQFVAVATRSHLPGAAVLAESLRRHHPDARLVCYLVEDDVADADSCDGLLDIVPVGRLELPGGRSFLFQYSAFELCCALKPFVIADRFARFGASAVVYLDTDLYVCAPFLEPVREGWRRHAVLVTPHLFLPAREADFSYIARAGAYNAGFVAVADCPESAAMLNWWKGRLARDCYFDYLGGVLVDQRWLDLAAGMFPCVRPLWHRGMNVGHWNLHECAFAREDGRLAVAPGVPLCLFHFSAFQNPGLTRHATILGEVPPEVIELANGYERELQAHARPPGASPYAFGHFADGTPIALEMREAVRQGRVNVPDPFADKEAVLAALRDAGADALVDVRLDVRLARLAERATELRCRLEQSEQQLWEARSRLERIRKHPVIGRVLRAWNRLVNPGL